MGKKFEFDFVPYTTDQIREMSEEDLWKNINMFKRKIREAHKSGKDTHPYEVEFCYLDHERIMRDKTKKFHDRNRGRNRSRSYNKTEGSNSTGR